MDDIHVYLPDGKRVVISEPDSSFANYDFKASLQVRKWYGWKTVTAFVYDDVPITELESKIDVMVCDLLAEHELDVSRERAEKAANARLQSIFHGKVRDVKCPTESRN